MTTQHSPSPWKVVLNPGADLLTIQSYRHTVAEIYPRDEASIIGSQENMDAKLIATAPELLEYLKIMTELAKSCNGYAILPASIANAEQVISKAEGR